MTTFADVPHHPSSSPNINDINTPVINTNSAKNRGLFGANGFTFLDFLDIINPLQHIPVISKIYRAITGDEIDPGSKIAGATIFGGPLGTVISSLDIAIENKTGHDIAGHATAFLTGSVNTGDKKDLNPRNNTYNPISSVGLHTIKANVGKEELFQPPFVQGVEQEPNTATKKTKEVSSAGMTAIPIPQRSYFSAIQTKNILASKSGRHNFLPPANTVSEIKTIPLNKNFNTQPQMLTPRYSTEAAVISKNYYNRMDQKDTLNIKTNNQELSPSEGSWLVNAMVLGLGKYEETSRLTLNSNAQKYSVSR